MPRRLALLGTWLLATAVATALAWVAVRQVISDVVPPPAAAAIAPPVTVAPAATAAATAVPETTQTVDVLGGSVTVRYGDGTTELVSHVAAPGYTADLRSSGPQRVDVRFRSEDHESRVVVDQEGGVPRVRPEEDDR